MGMGESKAFELDCRDMGCAEWGKKVGYACRHISQVSSSLVLRQHHDTRILAVVRL